MDVKPPARERRPVARDDKPMMLAMALFVLACLLLLVGAGAAIVIGVVVPG